jgi:hypothetical protein
MCCNHHPPLPPPNKKVLKAFIGQTKFRKN